jgi:hypothetical protein
MGSATTDLSVNCIGPHFNAVKLADIDGTDYPRWCAQITRSREQPFRDGKDENKREDIS